VESCSGEKIKKTPGIDTKGKTKEPATRGRKGKKHLQEKKGSIQAIPKPETFHPWKSMWGRGLRTSRSEGERG